MQDKDLTADSPLFTSCRITSGVMSPCCIILESISDGVFTIDPQKRISSFNRAAENITGFQAAEAVGHFCFDIFRADICEKRCALDKTLASGNPQINLPANIITKNGRQKIISISTSVLKNEVGKIIGAVETFRDLSELRELRKHLTHNFTSDDIVGKHPKMREILSSLPDIAASESPVLIEGPTGSGKELVARAVHSLSPRKKGPFVPVNCAALPDTLLESELFGFARGAFTGAVRKKAGRFLAANKGTIFLDEISSTSMAFQVHLLRILEDGVFTPLGETRPVKVDFRVVTATNHDLKQLMREGKFRQDLYFRLNVAKISLPPLRERKEDIPLLINHCIQKFNFIKGKNIQGVSPEVLSFLIDYPFPGNIRELENIIEYAFILCKGPTIEMDHLSKDLLDEPSGWYQRTYEPESPQEFKELTKIRAVLEQCQGNRIEAAHALGLSRTTLWRKMKKYGLMG